MIVIGTQNINPQRDFLFVDLTVDGDLCHFTHVAPANLDAIELTAYAAEREKSYAYDIIRDMYPDRIAELSSLDEILAWITDGCIIPATDNEPERVAKKVPFAGTHPVEETFADLVEDKAPINAAIAKIADPETRNALQLIFASKVRRMGRPK